ncbi:MAG: Asp23/Gls24 family envelope stress response protein [Chloroflexota bacterium]|nr:Asp23/Gls24 family envelope stress response protein [Anaerolineales bacterium]MCB8968739.1 Asp23/Gls24 family envelope stress response protein [Ardenticatenaceae bacterium]
MSATHDEPLGTIDISETTVSTIASRAINQCYGVVGMASKNLAGGIASLLSRDIKRGIDVTIEDGGIMVDVYVIVEYGVRIRAVAESIQNTVKFHVEKSLGLPVRAVNVYVQGLRQSKSQT